MKRFKKLVAGVLAATLVMGSASAFLATEQSSSGGAGGSSDFEGNKPAEVFSVDLPTIPAATSNSTFDFILDPEGLIAETNGGNWADGTTFATSSLYFKNNKASGAAYDYSNTTDALVVTNKSSTDVTVTLNATVTVPASNSAVKFTADSSFASDSSTSIYLALKDSNNATPSAITAAGDAGKATLTATVASCSGYVLTATNDTYKYTLPDGYNTFATYGFYLTGACNEAADWSNYDTNAEATVNVTWTVKPVSTAAATTTVNNGTYEITFSKTNGMSVPYTLAEGVTISSVKSGTSATTCTVDMASYTDTSNNTLTVSGIWGGANVGVVKYLLITFSDDTSVTLKLTIGA